MGNDQPLILRLSDKRGEGAYSHIFVVPGSNRAYKLFLNTQAPSPSPAAIQNEAKRQLVFEDEVKAYGLASSIPELKRHVPKFFGSQTVSDVLARLSPISGWPRPADTGQMHERKLG